MSARALAWLVRDTFRQSQATGVFWLMLAVSAVCVVGCLLLTVGPVPPPEGSTEAWARAELPFPGWHLDVPGTEADAVRAVQARLGAWVADVAGLLLALLWTAGLLPTFLEPASVTVLLAKPVSRPALLLGKCLGVLLFVAFQALVLVAGTWLALGLRTGTWGASYFLCLPLLLLQFVTFFGFSAMLAVPTRSTVVCLVGTLFFWLLCWAVNFGRHALRTLAELEGLSQGVGGTIELGYWLLPKPLDFQLVLHEALGSPQALPLLDFGLLVERGLWSPALSLLASGLCGAALLALAAYDFTTAEY